MDGNTKKEIKKSWLAGIIGGVVGYLLGAMADSQWLSFAMFFTLGYLGYDIRQVISAVKTVGKTIVSGFIEFWKEAYGEGIAWFVALISFIPFLIPSYIVIDRYTQIWKVVNADTLGNTLLTITGQGTAAIGMATITSLCCMGVINLAILFSKSPMLYLKRLGTVLAVPFVAVWKFICSLNRNSFIKAMKMLVLMQFYVLVGPFVLIAKALVLFLKLIHSARRLATGIAVLLGGAIYMYFVPFNFAGMPIVLSAILCGASTGATTVVVQYFMDGDKVGNWIATFLAKPIRAYAPSAIQ